MKRRLAIIFVALLGFAIFVFIPFVEQIRYPSTQQQANSFFRQDLPIGSSRVQVEAWLKSRRAEYGFVPKSKFQDYWFPSNGNRVRDVRKLIVVYLPNRPDLGAKIKPTPIEIYFFFDERDRLINRVVTPFDN